MDKKIIISTIGLAIAGNLTLTFPAQAFTITTTGNFVFRFDEDIDNNSEYEWEVDSDSLEDVSILPRNFQENSFFLGILASSTTEWTFNVWNTNGSDDESNWTMENIPSFFCCPLPQSNSLINYFASVPSSIFGFFLGKPALAQTGVISGDLSCGSCPVPEPITGVILGGLAAGGWMVKRKKQKSV